MTDDFKTRMRQKAESPSVPSVNTPSANVVPLRGVTDEALMRVKTGTVVQRPMTPEEIAAVKQGNVPNVNLSEAERRGLLKMGWSEGQPVPPNISAIFAKVVSEYKADVVRQGLSAPLEIKDIADLPQQEQERVRTAIQESAALLQQRSHASTSTFSAYPPAVADALQSMENGTLKEVIIPGWKSTFSASDVPSQPKPAAPAVPAAPAEVIADEPSVPAQDDPLDSAKFLKRCVHCGGDPFEDMTKSPISDEDKYEYLLAVGTGKPFEKEYTIFNKTIRARFRALRPGEYDIIAAWAGSKAQEETKSVKVDFQTFVEIVRRYESIAAVSLQTTYVRGLLPGSTLFWAAASGNSPGLKDWEAEYGIKTLDDLIARFYAAVGADAVIAALRERLSQFLLLDHRLTSNANDIENFWVRT